MSEFPRRPRHHNYQGDGITDNRGADRCTICGLPKRNLKVHDPATTADYSRRITGEREDGYADEPMF